MSTFDYFMLALLYMSSPVLTVVGLCKLRAKPTPKPSLLLVNPNLLK